MVFPQVYKLICYNGFPLFSHFWISVNTPYSDRTWPWRLWLATRLWSQGWPTMHDLFHCSIPLLHGPFFGVVPCCNLIADLWEIREWSRLLFCNLIVCLKKYLVDPWCSVPSCDDESTPTTAYSWRLLRISSISFFRQEKTSKNMSTLWLLNLTTDNYPQRSLEVSILNNRIFQLARFVYQRLLSVKSYLLMDLPCDKGAIPNFQLNSQRLTCFFNIYIYVYIYIFKILGNVMCLEVSRVGITEAQVRSKLCRG